MTTVPLDLHRDPEKQKTSNEMSTLRFVVLFSVWGVAIFMALFGFFFSLPDL